MVIPNKQYDNEDDYYCILCLAAGHIKGKITRVRISVENQTVLAVLHNTHSVEALGKIKKLTF